MDDRELDQRNQQLRASPYYTEWMRQAGVDTTRPIALSDDQRKQFASDLAARGVSIDGMEIDPAGNFNQNEGFGKQLKKWGPIAGGAALTAFGIPGVLPGLIGGGGAMSAAQMAQFGAPVAASNSAAAMGLAGGGGMWGSLLNILKNPATLSTIGRTLTGKAQADAQNRGTQLSAELLARQIANNEQMGYETSLRNREDSQRREYDDAWQKLQQAAYTAQGTPQSAGVSPYARALQPAPESVRQAATAFQTTNQNRLDTPLAPIDPRSPMPDVRGALQGSAWDKLLEYGGAGLDIFGRLKK